MSWFRLPVVSAMALAATGAAAPGQGLSFVLHNGAHTAYCGAPTGGLGAINRFSTLDPVHDVLAFEDDGSGILPPTAATSRFDAAPTATGIVMAGFGSGQRGSPTGFGANATADVRDLWEFTLSAATPFSLDVALSTSSTELPVPGCTFLFATMGQGGIVLADGSVVSVSHILSQPGSVAAGYTGTLLPGRYFIMLNGRIEGMQTPFAGSFSNWAQLHIGSCDPADFNADGVVDLDDLLPLLGGFGTPSGATNADGDVDGDGDIDLSDLLVLLAAFGVTCA